MSIMHRFDPHCFARTVVSIPTCLALSHILSLKSHGHSSTRTAMPQSMKFHCGECRRMVLDLQLVDPEKYLGLTVAGPQPLCDVIPAMERCRQSKLCAYLKMGYCLQYCPCRPRSTDWKPNFNRVLNQRAQNQAKKRAKADGRSCSAAMADSWCFISSSLFCATVLEAVCP